MLAYLLDENISSVIAEQLSRKSPGMTVHSVHRWRDGALAGQPDDRVLRAATAEQLTLVTYDLNTIPPLLRELASDSEAHAGVLFIDETSIRNSDFGGLVAALLAHWQRYGAEEWTNRVAFLTAVSR